MANEKKAAEKAATATKKDVELKGVKVTYIDKPERLQKVYEQRLAEGRIDSIGNVFVHMNVEVDGTEYGGLSQTLRVLGQKDYEELLKANAEGTPIDITVRIDDKSAKTGNYFFYVSRGDVSVSDLFKEPFAKPSAPRRSVIDLLG